MCVCVCVWPFCLSMVHFSFITFFMQHVTHTQNENTFKFNWIKINIFESKEWMEQKRHSCDFEHQKRPKAKRNRIFQCWCCALLNNNVWIVEVSFLCVYFVLGGWNVNVATRGWGEVVRVAKHNRQSFSSHRVIPSRRSSQLSSFEFLTDIQFRCRNASALISPSVWGRALISRLRQ